MDKSQKLIVLEQENKNLKERLAKAKKASMVYAELLHRKSKAKKILGFTLHKRKTGKWYGSRRIDGKQKWAYVGVNPDKAKEKITAWLSKHHPFHFPDSEEKLLSQEDFSVSILALEDQANELLIRIQKMRNNIPVRFTSEEFWESIRDDIDREIEQTNQMEYLLSRLSEIEERKEYKKSVRVKLWLVIERNSKFVKGKKKVREDIEFFILNNYNMKKLNDNNYELTIPYENDEDLKRIIDDIFSEMHDSADMRHCFIEGDMTEIGGDRFWD